MLFEELDLSAFELKETLNPLLFDKENDKLKIDVRQTLLDIANDFYTDLKVNIDYQDIILVGSNAGFHWSEFSDVDLHIVIPFEEISGDDEFIKDYLDTKKNNWNNQHDLKIGVHNIEVYVQDTKEENVSGGIYSILFDAWIKFPSKDDVYFDKDAVESEVNNLLNKFRNVLKHRNDPENFEDALELFSDHLKGLREKGLKGDGEFSAENLAFKYLRHLGLHDKLRGLKNHAYDTKKSIVHGTSLGGYTSSSKQRKLAGNKAHVKKRDALTKYKDGGKKKDKSGYSDGIYYSIHGILFSSLREASKKTGEKKSTIQYRVHSTNPKYTDYKIIYKK